MSKNWPVGLSRVACALLIVSLSTVVFFSSATAPAADERPALEQPASDNPAAEKPEINSTSEVEKSSAETDVEKSAIDESAGTEAGANVDVVEEKQNAAATANESDKQTAKPPLVTKGQVDAISGESAVVRFQVQPYAGKNLQVAVFYGESDGGQTQEDWQFNSGIVTHDKSMSQIDYTVKLSQDLKPLTGYFYRVCAKTSDGVSWSEPGEFETARAATPWYVVAGVAVGIGLLFVVPFWFGSFVANGLRMPDYGWKIGLIIWSLACGVVVVVFGWPPHLGIDLSGGVILVYELEDSGEEPALQKPAGNKAAAEKAAEDDQGDENDRQDGAADAEQDEAARKVDMQKLMGAMALRVNPGGTREITIRQYGPQQIEIIIPRASDEQVKRIEEKVSRAGTLSFRILANEKDHPDVIALARQTEGKRVRNAAGELIAVWTPVTKDREDAFATYSSIATRTQNYAGEESLEILVAIDPYNVTGDYLSSCTIGYDNLQPCVDFVFNNQGGRRFGALTSDNLPDEVGDFKRHLGIILDGHLYSAPTINDRITTRGQITGGFSKQEAQDLVDVLNAGSLPAALKKNPISRLSTGPTLGHDTIVRGAWAIGISLAVVLVFMVIYYQFSGLVACFALLTTLLLVLAVMIAVKADFTLPGIAGLVLTVGMAVDANVIIFERIREELAKQAALRMAIRNGFAHATSAVVDASLTTLITATVLFVIGTEQIKGFAVTLWLGVVLSMYTAIFCSRVIFDVAERQRWIKKLSMRQFFSQPKFDFIGMRYLGATISVLLIVVGLICVAARGKGLLDIDFTGGASVQVLFKNPQDIAEVRRQLADLPDLAVSDVQLLEGEEQRRRFIINTSLQADEQQSDQQSSKNASGDQDENSITLVENHISKVFAGKLATNELTVGELAPQRFALDFQYAVNAETLSDYLNTALEASGASDASFGLDRKEGFRPSDNEPYHDWIVQTTLSPEKAQAVFAALKAKIDAEPFFPSSSSIGGRVARDMQLKAIYALLASLVFIVAYIWIRFQRVMFGLAAVAALVHDVLITLGALAASAFVASYLGFLLIEDFKIGLSVLAAFLTIIGYSLNDTIVVFDRIREVRGKSPQISGEMINLSINQTLSRTVLTSLTTLMVVAILYVGGGQGIHAFAFSLMVGVIVGTYSSIFVASPILYWMGHSAAKSNHPTNSK